MRTPSQRKRRLTFVSFPEDEDEEREVKHQQDEIQRWTEQEKEELKRYPFTSLLPSSQHFHKHTTLLSLLLFNLMTPSFAQEDTTNNNEDSTTTSTSSINSSPSITTVKQIIAYALITIAVLSLFGWGYVFYLRHQYHQQESNNNDKCCVDPEKGVRLNTPPRLKHANNNHNTHHTNNNNDSHSQRGNSIDGRFDFTVKAPKQNKPQPRNTKIVDQSYMSNSTYQPDEESQDSFARELPNAARQDTIIIM